MNLNFELEKKTLIVLGVMAVAVVLFIAFVPPLWSRANALSREARTMDSDLGAIRSMLDESRHLNKDRHLLSRGEVSVAMNEIMEMGAALDIDFFETNPQPIQKDPQAGFPVLPITILLQSTYRDFGTFLGGLEDLNMSIVTVKEFNIDRDPIILPDIRVVLVLEIHLKEGEGG